MDLSRPQLLILAESPDAFVEFVRHFDVGTAASGRAAARVSAKRSLFQTRRTGIAAHLAKPSWARAEVALEFSTPRDRIRSWSMTSRPAPSASWSFRPDFIMMRVCSKRSPKRRRRLCWSIRPAFAGPMPLWKNDSADFRVAAVARPRLARASRLWRQSDGSTFLRRGCGPDRGMRRRRGSQRMCGTSQTCAAGFLSRAPVRAQSPWRKNSRATSRKTVSWISRAFSIRRLRIGSLGRLCRTSIRPNHVTFVTMLHRSRGDSALRDRPSLVGRGAGLRDRSARWRRWQTGPDESRNDARRRMGTRKSIIAIELSWWTALAFHFHGAGLRSAFWLLAFYVGSDLLDRLAKRAVKKKVGRNLDDVSNFDRFVRCIGARRNINIWILIAALVLGDAGQRIRSDLLVGRRDRRRASGSRRCKSGGSSPATAGSPDECDPGSRRKHRAIRSAGLRST